MNNEKEMKENQLTHEMLGWVVINTNHPSNPKFKNIFYNTFRRTRTESIYSFIKTSNNDWRWWKQTYNFRCVKANSIINTINA